MFAAGVRKKTPEKENATEFIGQIDPATLISIIRVQNEQKNQIPEPLVDPLPDIERRQKKKSKKQRKRQQKNSESDKPLFKTGEIEAKKGVYYLHQANGALFCTDKAGDAENRIFQKIYNGELPIYKRINRGILGAAWIKPKDKKKVKNDGPGRYYAKSNRKIIRSAPAATARAVRTRNKVQEAVDNQTPHLIIYETELVEEFEQNTEIDILQLKTRDFNRKLQEDKTNINLWLEFVAFQDELFEDQIEKSENGRNISKKNLNEKKVAIIDRALDVNTKSVRLRVALLNQAREIWTPEELGKRWETLVFSNPHLPELWRFFMETQYNTPLKSILKYYVKQFETLGAISEGSYAATPPENLEEEMIINLDHLETGQLALRGHTERTTAIYQAMIELNLFCPPPLRMRNRENKLKALEHYWEANVPRCGEEGHISWNEWFNAAGRERCREKFDEDLDETELGLIDPDEASGLSWARIEVHRDKSQWIPLRSLENDDDLLDADRRIKFQDIRNILFCLPDDQLCIRLLFAYLKYLGAPTLNDRTPGDLQSDEFYNRSLVSTGQLMFDNQKAKKPNNMVEALSSLCGSNFTDPMPPAAGQTYDVDRIIGHLPKTNHQFVLRVLQQVLEKTEATGAMNDIDSKISLGTNVIYYATKRLEQLKAAGSKIDKNHKDYKEGKKCAKQVLKREEMRGNIIPWCQFAAFEIEVTGVKTTLKDIYSQCLSLAYSLKTKADASKATSSIFYVFGEMSDSILFKSLHDDLPEFKNMFISAVGSALVKKEAPNYDTKFENVDLLKIRGELIEHLAIQSRSYRHEIYSYYGWSWSCSAFSNVVKTLACFEVLIDDVPSSLECIDRALDIMRSSLKPLVTSYDDTVLDSCEIRRRRADLHSLQLFRIKLFSRFGLESGKPSLNLAKYRQFVSSSLDDFPSSPFFLYCWMKVESHKVGIHSSSDNLKGADKSLIRRLFSILYDLSRESRVNAIRNPDGGSSDNISTGLTLRVRGKFEKAISNFPRCVLLWRLYLAFEKKNGDEVRYEKVFYRSMEHLPHVKCLYIDAMIFMPYRVDEFLRTMSDRDIRTRTPIEEIRMLLDAPPGEKPAPEVVIVDDDVDVPEIQIKDESTKQEKRASIVRELSPDRIGDFEDDEDQYESVPAYEAPHKRDEESSKKSSRSSRKRKKGVQYPDPEFDRRWERKRREEEDLKQREIEDKRQKREDERARKFSRYDEENGYNSDNQSSRRSRSRSRSRSYDTRSRRTRSRSYTPDRQRSRNTRSRSYTPENKRTRAYSDDKYNDRPRDRKSSRERKSDRR